MKEAVRKLPVRLVFIVLTAPLILVGVVFSLIGAGFLVGKTLMDHVIDKHIL